MAKKLRIYLSGRENSESLKNLVLRKNRVLLQENNLGRCDEQRNELGSSH